MDPLSGDRLRPVDSDGDPDRSFERTCEFGKDGARDSGLMSDDSNWEVEPDQLQSFCILQGGIAITINMLINNNIREDGKNDRWNAVCPTCPRGCAGRRSHDRKNSRRFSCLEINRVSAWTSDQFCAQIVAGPIPGERLQLDGGTRPEPSWSLLLNLPLVRKSGRRWRCRNLPVDTELTDMGGVTMPS
jgi:hypothetical protein